MKFSTASAVFFAASSVHALDLSQYSTTLGETFTTFVTEFFTSLENPCANFTDNFDNIATVVLSIPGHYTVYEQRLGELQDYKDTLVSLDGSVSTNHILGHFSATDVAPFVKFNLTIETTRDGQTTSSTHEADMSVIRGDGEDFKAHAAQVGIYEISY